MVRRRVLRRRHRADAAPARGPVHGVPGGLGASASRRLDVALCRASEPEARDAGVRAGLRRLAGARQRLRPEPFPLARRAHRVRRARRARAVAAGSAGEGPRVPVADSVVASDYPPPQHLYRDLHLEVDQRAEIPVVRVPIVPELLGPGGAVRTGVLGIGLDVFGGNLAVEAAAPDWALTAQLELHVLAPLRAGVITVTGRPLRAGKTNLVAEAEIRGDDGDGAPCAVGRLTFTRVPARGGEPPRARRGGLLYAFAEGAEKLTAPFHDAAGLRVLDAAAGCVEIPIVPYVINSVGALNGGMVVALADAAA